MTSSHSKKPSLVVALGASAGGLDAYTAFFSDMPAHTGMAFILLPHLAPEQPSIMASLLSKNTELVVEDIVQDTKMQADHIYILPAGKQLRIIKNRLHLDPISDPHDKWMIIDRFFVSLAAECGSKAVAVILSGTGSHGTLGFKDIKIAGGLLIAQAPDTAQFEQMPQNAIATGMIDMVLAPKDMPKALFNYQHHPFLNADDNSQAATTQHDLPAILKVVKEKVKYDFSGYRKSMLLRRIYRRMGIHGIKDVGQYTAYLSTHPEEISELNKDFLIGVTSFFRDKDAFTLLERNVFPELIRSLKADTPLRIWVPACSTGEEAYSICILLIEGFERANVPLKLQLFASDIDNDSLQKARKGIYDKEALQNISPARLQRFFTPLPNKKYKIKQQLRDHILFACQNLIGDAPFSRLDFISCRNLLIYLQPELQRKVLNLFHFALKPSAFLMLGPSEAIAKGAGKFEVINKKWRLFKSIGMTHHDGFSLPMGGQSARNSMSLPPALEGEIVQPHSLTKYSGLLQRGLLEAYAPAAVLINRGYQILQLHGPTVNFLEFPKGSPTYDLLSLLRDGLRTRVRAAVQKAIEQNQVIVDDQARVKIAGHYKPCMLTVRPIVASLDTERAYLITFEDKNIIELNHIEAPLDKKSIAFQDEQQGRQVIEQLEYELNSMRDDLRTTLLDLEQSNEDLKVSNEEVMSMNEELQSANEELETSKEELQSMNEELNSVNVELLWKVEQLENSHNDVLNLLSSTAVATIFLDRQMHIKLFNPAIKSLLNLQDKDLGRKISDFSANVADDTLIKDAQRVLDKNDGVSAVVHQRANSESAKSYLRSIVPYRTSDNRVDGVVITFVEVTALHQQRRNLEKLFDVRNKQLKLEQERLESIMGAAFEGIIVMTKDGRISEFNSSAEKTFCYKENELLGVNVVQLFESLERERLQQYLTAVAEQHPSKRVAEARAFSALKKDGSQFPIELNLSPIDDSGLYIATIRDLTEQKSLQKKVMDVVAHEQEKIGIELHDSVGQKLTGISLLVNNLKQKLDSSKEVQLCAIDEIASQVKDSIGDIRHICQGLAPLSITQEGLPYVLKNMLESIKHAGLKTHFSVSKDFKIEDRVIAIQYYRIAQEAVNNALKHAHAKHLSITLSQQHNRPKMLIKDDGKGFSPDSVKASHGIGLKTMRYRAAAIGAKLTIDSSAEQGSSIRCYY